MPKIAFVWEWDRAKEIYPNWRDGLRAAMEIISKKWTVDWLLYETPKKNYDWILTWCDSNSQFSRFFSDYPTKRGIFLTTDPTNYHNLEGFDIVFCETSVVYNECRQFGLRAVKTYATDEKFFVPGNLKKDIPYFYPATFSPWKKQSDIAYLGNRLVCVGTIQPDGRAEYEICQQMGVKTEVGYFPPEKILNYYQRAQTVIIPAVHGSERTVLEAMSCNVWPIVTNELNRRTRTYVDEFIKWRQGGSQTLRKFILECYSAKLHASRIMKAIRDYDE
jgi:glycosyltransferase involved in cell wall biosynthesis